MVCEPPVPDGVPGALEGLTLSFCPCYISVKGRSRLTSPLASSFFLPAFALASACSAAEQLGLFGIFCSSFQTITVDFFSKDLNCMSRPLSPEHRELAPLPWHSGISVYPGHFLLWLLKHTLGFSWTHAGSPLSTLTKGARLSFCRPGNFSLFLLNSKV